MNLEANPQFYDYLHRISLYDDGSCEFADGGGQCINLAIKGEFYLNYSNDMEDSGYIDFYFDTKYEECDHSELSDSDDKQFDKQFKVNFKVRQGPFIMLDEIVWNSTFEDRNISIYTRRFVFDANPFDGIYQNRDSNLYFILEGDKESDESLKCFYSYDDKITKKMKELNDVELNKIKESNPKFYEAFINNPTMKMSEYNKQQDNSDKDD